jgi:NADH-quinone oxidoreductase subunit H
MDITWQKLVFAVVMPLFGILTGLFYMGANRVITARIQNRYGPPLKQQLIDVIKLYTKETAISHGVMFHLAPTIAITGSISTLLFLPVFKGAEITSLFHFQGDLVMIIYLMVLGCLGMALGAGQSGNPNSAIGVSRGLSQMVGYEVPFVISVIVLMLRTHSTSIEAIMQQQTGFLEWNLFQAPFAAIAGLISFLGMMGYKPFDVPVAPAEIYSGPPAEYGGKYLALMQTNRALFAFAKLVLFMDLYLGGATNIFSLVLKTFALYLVVIFISAVNPRFRTEQSIRFFWTWPTLIGLAGLARLIWF